MSKFGLPDVWPTYGGGSYGGGYGGGLNYYHPSQGVGLIPPTFTPYQGGMNQIGNGGNTVCNCLHGTAQMVNGVCTCENNPVNNNPSHLPPIIKNDNPPMNIQPMPLIAKDNIVDKIVTWSKENPAVAIGLAITAYVAFFKKK